jgi:modification methylase
VTTNHRVVFGDARFMPELPDAAVHLVVTSPPYWQLKDYGTRNQLGFHQSYEDYINHLNLVWSECARVLHPGCRMVVNIGDQFARSVYYGRYKVIPIREEIIRCCEHLGMDYMGAVIWQKVTTTNTTGGASIMGSFPNPRNGILKLDYEFILIFKKLGDAPRPTAEQKEQAKMTTEEWNTFFAGHWNFAGAKQDEHIAVFPKELPSRLIRMFTFPGETVLDPFLGSGTTALAAKELGRNSVGFEINPEFEALMRRKIIGDDLFAGAAELSFLARKAQDFDEAAALERLPYLFRDPHRMDKKLDLKQLRYGSRIDGSEAPRTDLHKVRTIVSPEVLGLDSGLEVRLLGIKALAGQAEKARGFLTEATRGQRIYLDHDEAKHDEAGRLLAYAYLENRTFLNARLIKAGLAEVDTSRTFRHRARFLAYQKDGTALSS